MVKISVERTMRDSFLIIEEQEGTETQRDVHFETQMLSGNRIAGMLEMQVRTVDCRVRYQYPFTGKTALKQKFENEQMDADAIRIVIEGVRNAYLRAEEYLLRAEHVIVDPSCIFWDRDQNSVSFCCCPVWDVPVKKGLQELAEFMISVTDHAQEYAIDLSYGFYRKIMSGDYRFDDLPERKAEQKPDKVVAQEEYAYEPVPGSCKKESGRGALGILGFAAVFALVVCFTLCLLLLKFR